NSSNSFKVGINKVSNPKRILLSKPIAKNSANEVSLATSMYINEASHTCING
ncbi:9216_t:CDS:1, partial [Cetraspora pellucida]